MRLGALLLIPAALTAQSRLPWEDTQELPWETVIPEAPPLPWTAPGPLPASIPQCLVSLSGDGTLRISDMRGRVTLRLGLSGRPLQILRDAGIPMTLGDFPSDFPVETPLTKGLGNLPLAGDDFRNALQGLLWILDDGERRITVVHPATRQVVYIPLPTGQNWGINLYPDRLEVQERALPGEEHRERACWSISWLILLPQFVRLSLPQPAGNPGTAFRPFPAE